jgi:hypothetical protein
MPLTEKTIPAKKWFSSDNQLNLIYPLAMQGLAKKHWTPLGVTRKVTEFLAVEDGARILDIGSGIGKFCLAAAHYKPKAFFYGIEQRKNLINCAEITRQKLGINNVSFIYGNFTALDLRNYDHFYFYNAFYENIAITEKIDNSIAYSGELYNYYNRYLCQQLEQKPVGTRVATFHSLGYEVPKDYHMVHSELDNQLKFWVKV